MRVLLVRVADYMWGFTAQYVAQLLHLSADQLLWIADRRVMILHNEFIPVVSLAGLLGLASSTADADSPILMLVVKVRHEKLALIIDQLEDERDMLIKPLPPHLRTNQRVSGMVVLGDQSLVSVLHAPALLSLAKMQRQQGQKQVKTGQMSATVRQWHILVVDDSLNTREIEKDVLEAYGYQVTLAEDGLDGLMKARDGQFDAILTDVEMPNMDGFTLTTQLRQLDKYRHTPIMMITSREKEEDKRRGIQVGADAYIVKSDFEQNNLVSTLQALLGA
jgi:two-component system chemotaxis sensor kinase CheA